MVHEIDISGNIYYSYASLLEASNYLLADVARGDSWNLLTDLIKTKSLISATRAIDSLRFKGLPTSLSQPLQFPRTGLITITGTEQDSLTVPASVNIATILLAHDYSQNPTIFSTASSPNTTKKAKAGSAEVEFFKTNTQQLLNNNILLPYLYQYLDSSEINKLKGVNSSGVYMNGGTFNPISFDKNGATS